jgi:hypothetical protein
MHHLYEEYQEYEKMWEESSEIKASTLTEGLIVQTLAELVAGVSFFIGTIGAVGIFLSGGGLFTALAVAVISLIVKILAEVISEFTLPVFPLTGGLFEDLGDAEADLQQLIANINILQMAQTNLKIQKQVQTLYTLVGPAKAQIIINKLETWLHKQSKFLAALLKRTTAKELEAQEELIIQQALSYAQAEIAVNNTEEH